MYRVFFRRLNLVIYLLIAAGAAILQSTVFHYWPFNYLHPDVVFVMAVYFGYRRSLVEGSLLTILASLVMQAHSGAGHHFLLTTYVYVFLCAHLLSRFFVIKKAVAAAGMGAALFALKQVGILVLLGLQGRLQNAAQHLLLHFVPSLAVQAAILPILFEAFHRLDLRTWADAHAEDDYDLNKEI